MEGVTASVVESVWLKVLPMLTVALVWSSKGTVILWVKSESRVRVLEASSLSSE